MHVSVSPFIQSEHTHAPDGEKKNVAFQKSLLGVLSIDIHIPFPQR